MIWVGFMEKNAITYDLSRIKSPTLSMEKLQENPSSKSSHKPRVGANPRPGGA